MARHAHDSRHLEEQVLQALQVELGTIEIVTAALSTCSAADAQEWAEAREEACAYRDVLVNVLVNLAVDPDAMTPGRRLAIHHRDSLVQAIEAARHDGGAAAQAVARECVALAEKIARQSRERIGLLLERSRKRSLQRAGMRGDPVPALARTLGVLPATAYASPLGSRAA